MDFLPPIAAVGTPFGKGALAVLRLSGEDAHTVAKRVFFPKSGLFPARTALYGEIRDPETGELLDDGMLTLFSAPHSYTGEDMAELCCHGGTTVTALCLKALLCAGARMALPGEFTRRAFAAGKLSLSRAEGIADLIDAKTDAAARLARKEASGALARKLDALREEFLQILAAQCVVMDYPEEDLAPMNAQSLKDRLLSLGASLFALQKTLSAARAVTEGVPAYIIGRTNVGKSSFFNRLLGRECAIVTDIPGTTRDLIEYPLQAGTLLLRLTDTAGLRESDDTVEKLGIERTKKALESSEGALIFALFDCSEEATEEDRALVENLVRLSEKHRVFPVLTKTDKPERLDRSLLAPLGDLFCISLLDDCDFSPLFSALEHAYIEDEEALLRGEVLMNLRQFDCVRRAYDAVSEAVKHVSDTENDVCVTLLEEALGALTEADGREVAAGVADEIFKRFCVGK